MRGEYRPRYWSVRVDNQPHVRQDIAGLLATPPHLAASLHSAQTVDNAVAGIDQALWDLCGKECGQLLYRLFGGAMRDEVNYCYYLSQGSPEHVERECAEGVHADTPTSISRLASIVRPRRRC